MIDGIVTEEGTPVVRLELDGDSWLTVVDSGFNGALELPLELKDRLSTVPMGTVRSELAAGVLVEEESFMIVLPFDGEKVLAQVTFADVEQALLGTELLTNHRLEIDFPARTVHLFRPTQT